MGEHRVLGSTPYLNCTFRTSDRLLDLAAFVYDEAVLFDCLTHPLCVGSYPLEHIEPCLAAISVPLTCPSTNTHVQRVEASTQATER